ncbi:hypothetical protein SLS56_004501 [Neofusicoccum ribis]|uniref:Esterase family protein n=1 Tax=Neofusicoccum ribis TaxID=45134 RepID=A0ABR3SW22_9PEZI
MEYLSCSGATSPQILDQQVSKLGTGYDLITVSAGGNDVGLADVLNHCIFQWMPGRDKNCDDQLAKTEDLVKNTLPKNLDALAAGLKGKTASLRKVFWTGYARFFDEATPDCDQITWSFFYNLGPVFQKQYLTQARRKRMNDLTVAVNAAIRDAVGRAGSDFIFVDYDQYYDDLGGRFCESGVKEPDGNRQGLLFFEWGTNDDDTTLPSKRDIDYLELDDSYLENVYQPRDFEDDDAELVARQASSGNVTSFEDTIMDMIIQTKTDNTSLLIALPDHSGADPVYRGRTTLSKSDFVSDSILRVFHPRPGGHALVANLLIWNLASQQANSPDGPGGYQDEVGPAANEGCTLPVNEPAAPTSTVQVNRRV